MRGRSAETGARRRRLADPALAGLHDKKGAAQVVGRKLLMVADRESELSLNASLEGGITA